MKSLRVIVLFLVLMASIMPVKSNIPQYKSIVDLELFLQPLRMTTAGVHIFFEQLYNSRRYTEDFFPNNISCHMSQFLEHGKQTQQSPDFIKATFSLFGQKLKGCLYVSAYSFADFMMELPQLVDYAFIETDKSVEQRKQEVREVLFQEFLNNYESFQQNPSDFFDKLTNDIVGKTMPVDPSVDAARYGIIRFIELCCGKLLWDATDKNIWKNITQISEAIVGLAECNVIKDADDLNDIAWSLVHRLAYFIDIVGSELPIEFYEQIRDGLETNQLFNLEEQEELIETKRHHLERIVIDGIAKKQAQEFGVIA